PGGSYLVSGSMSLEATGDIHSGGIIGESGNSTRIYFDNLTPNAALFRIGPGIGYFTVEDVEFVDLNARTSRCFYFNDFRPSGYGPSWKHLFNKVRFTNFREGVRFDGGATTQADAHQSEVMF